MSGRGRLRYAPVLILSSAVCAVSAFGGSVIVDSSLGAAAGPQAKDAGGIFSITPALGRQTGRNLFYSFSRLNLDQGEVAAFNGPLSGISNVLARVTDGNPSTIDGTLRCSVPQANFYLMNSAGVVFGPNAAIDVQGSFAVTTADYVRLADGTTLNSSVAGPAVLTTAGPAAFGFLGARPAAITVRGALAVPPGNAISIVGEGVQIAGGRITALDGRINIVSAASAGEALLDASASSSSALPQFSGKTGAITLSNALIQSDAAGSVAVRAGDLSMSNSSIANVTVGPETGGGIDILLDGALAMQHSSIATSTSSPGVGGNIAVSAASVTLGSDGFIVAFATGSGRGGNVSVHASGGAVVDGRGSSANNDTRIGTETSGATGASAGDVTVEAASLQLFNTGEIESTSFGSGAGGKVRVATIGDLAIDGHDASAAAFTGILAQAEGTGDGGSVDVVAGNILLTGNPAVNGHTEIDTTTIGSGHGGPISINAQSLSVLNGARISAEAMSSGDGGSISVRASQSISMDQPAGGPLVLTGISTSASGGATGGNGGDIFVAAPTLQLKGGAFITSETSSRGRSGNITIEAGDLSLSGTGITDTPQFFVINLLSTSGREQVLPIAVTTVIDTSATGFTGNAGDIRISADTLTIVDNAYISASSFAKGDCGRIDIDARSLTLSQEGSRFGTGIFSSSLFPAGGNGGSITIRTAEANVLTGAIIATDTFGSGVGGDITVRADRLTLSAKDAGHVAGIGAQTHSLVNGGSGGNISIDAGQLNLTDDAAISASSLGSGKGGNVSVVAGNVRISSGALMASLAENTGDAGGIAVHSRDGILLSSGAIQTSALTSSGGDLTLNAGTSFSVVGRGLVSAQSGGNGGNIHVIAPDGLRLVRSSLTAEAGAAGGHVTIDSLSLVLDHSTIDARARTLPQRVRLHSNVFLLSSSRILTSTGQSFPETEIAGSLVALPEAVATGPQLLPQCGLQLGGSLSSFIVTGAGGGAVEPGGMLPDFRLELHDR